MQDLRVGNGPMPKKGDMVVVSHVSAVFCIFLSFIVKVGGFHQKIIFMIFLHVRH